MVRAIVNIPILIDAKSVSRFNGIINYLRRFLSELAKLIKPISQLTQGGNVDLDRRAVIGLWSHKLPTVEAPILSYWSISVAMYAVRQQSMGVKSRSLTRWSPDWLSQQNRDCKQKCAQLEQALLSCTLLKSSTFGRFTQVYSDHKPLIIREHREGYDHCQCAWRSVLTSRTTNKTSKFS